MEYGAHFLTNVSRLQVKSKLYQSEHMITTLRARYRQIYRKNFQAPMAMLSTLQMLHFEYHSGRTKNSKELSMFISDSI